jgi:hypothetical protein
MSETVILKKYASRRLYNPENSSYVTLNQVAGIIRGGQRGRYRIHPHTDYPGGGEEQECPFAAATAAPRHPLWQ